MCRREKPQFTRRPDGTVVQSGGGRVRMGDYWCPTCNTANFARNKYCKKCTAPKPHEPEIFRYYIIGKGKGKDKGKSKRADKGNAKGGKPGECLSSESDRLWAEYKPDARSKPYGDEARQEGWSDRGQWGDDRTGSWSDWERGASSAKRDSRSEPPAREGGEYSAENRRWMMRERPIFVCPDCNKWYLQFWPVDGVELVRCRRAGGRVNARRVWVDPHVKKISSGVRAAVEGGESAESESEVESGDSSDSIVGKDRTSRMEASPRTMMMTRSRAMIRSVKVKPKGRTLLN